MSHVHSGVSKNQRLLPRCFLTLVQEEAKFWNELGAVPVPAVSRVGMSVLSGSRVPEMHQVRNTNHSGYNFKLKNELLPQ